MDERIEAILQAYDERSQREWAGVVDAPTTVAGSRRDQMLLSVGREAGVFLNSLAKAAKSQRILELGTSYGYSTVWLAEAARATGGRVITLDVADYKQAEAKKALGQAGLEGHVEFHVGDALQIIPGLERGFDFVLLDVWKDLYVPCLDLFFPMLAPGAVIVADNMLQPALDRTNALAYRRAVRAKPGVSSVLLPIGQGLEVSRLAGPDDKEL